MRKTTKKALLGILEGVLSKKKLNITRKLACSAQISFAQTVFYGHKKMPREELFGGYSDRQSAQSFDWDKTGRFFP